MARTTKEIQQAILDEKAANTQLSALDSASSVSIWRLWTYVIATAIFVHETLWDAFKIEIETIKNRAISGTPFWYVDKAKAFQLGDTLEIDPVTFNVTYPVINEANQIIKRAAISSSGRVSTLKVAKEDGFGLPIKLSAPELTSFKIYMNENIQFAGSQINVISNAGDLLKLQSVIYYDGLLDLGQVKIDTEASINGYLANIDFDGRFLKNKLIDAIQQLGFDPDINVLEGKIAGGTYTDIDRIYNTLSGYLIIDPSFPLTTELTYIAE